jgi:hypothetical protein
MRLGSNDVDRVIKETIANIFLYSLYAFFFGLLAFKLWMKIR